MGKFQFIIVVSIFFSSQGILAQRDSIFKFNINDYQDDTFQPKVVRRVTPTNFKNTNILCYLNDKEFVGNPDSLIEKSFKEKRLASVEFITPKNYRNKEWYKNQNGVLLVHTLDQKPSVLKKE
jgi:hypothetical protein